MLTYKDGKPYEKELCANEKAMLKWLDENGFKYWRNASRMGRCNLRVEKDGVQMDFELYNNPMVLIDEQIDFFGRMWKLKKMIACS